MAKSPGRPSEYEEKKDEIIEWIRKGMNIRDACALAGIGKTAYYRWKAQYEEFEDDLKRAMLQNKHTRIQRILEAGKKQWQAEAWYLERMWSDEFALKNIVDLHDSRTEDPIDKLVALTIAQANPEKGKKYLEMLGMKEEQEDKEIPSKL